MTALRLIALICCAGSAFAQTFHWNPDLAARFERAYPELANVSGFEDIPFPRLSQQESERVRLSTEVSLAFGNRTLIYQANQYMLYTAPCDAQSRESRCHYLSVATGFSSVFEAMFGPVSLPDNSNPAPSRQ